LNVLFDTNVVLDVLMNRSPHAEAVAQLLVLVEQKKKLNGFLGATAVTTIHYLLRRSLGMTATRKHLRTLLSLFDVAPITWDILSDALNLHFTDFEDAVLHEAARHAGAVGIVTRDPKGFKKARLRIYSPIELLRTLSEPDTPRTESSQHQP
jgi:predicted nucleic acid-binding protein